MRKSNIEQKSQIPLGGSTVNADEAKFMTQSMKNDDKRERDNNFRLNVSQRRQINRGVSCDTKGDFEFKRNNFANTVTSVRSGRNITSGRSAFASQGEMILEKKFQISKDEQEYFNNSKVFTNVKNHVGGQKELIPRPDKMKTQSGGEINRYQQNVPTYMRIFDNPNNRNAVHR